MYVSAQFSTSLHVKNDNICLHNSTQHECSCVFQTAYINKKLRELFWFRSLLCSRNCSLENTSFCLAMQTLSKDNWRGIWIQDKVPIAHSLWLCRVLYVGMYLLVYTGTFFKMDVFSSSKILINPPWIWLWLHTSLLSLLLSTWRIW